MRALVIPVVLGVFCTCGGDGAMPPPDAGEHDAGQLDSDPLDANTPDASYDAGPLTAEDVSATVEAVRAEHGLISLAGAVVRSDGMIAVGASGLRRRDGTEAVETDDHWHLGSEAKAMTATLAAMLVEDGTLSWDTTVAEAFPSFADQIDLAFADVTLVHLLTHRSGLTGDLVADEPEAWSTLWMNQGSLSDQRLWLAEHLLTQPPAAAPATVFVYSNAGYIVAGAMLEQATGMAWEDLIGDRLFTPLAMDSCGFGAPGNAELVDEPWGHDGDALDPVSPGFAADNPPATGPAGTVHCALEDWAAFIALHLRGALDDTELLSAASFDRLHTDPGFASPGGGYGYAYGWSVVVRSWAGGDALTHTGSNTLWYAMAWLAPARDRAYLAVTNQADDAAGLGTDALVSGLRSSHPPD